MIILTPHASMHLLYASLPAFTRVSPPLLLYIIDTIPRVTRGSAMLIYSQHNYFITALYYHVALYALPIATNRAIKYYNYIQQILQMLLRCKSMYQLRAVFVNFHGLSIYILHARLFPVQSPSRRPAVFSRRGS